MSEPDPPWREFTTDDYYPVTRRSRSGYEPWIEASDWIQAMLTRQHAGEFRLRLILREAVDLKRGPKVNPTNIWDYEVGPSAVFAVRQVVIVTKDGRRHPAPVLGRAGLEKNGAL